MPGLGSHLISTPSCIPALPAAESSWIFCPVQCLAYLTGVLSQKQGRTPQPTMWNTDNNLPAQTCFLPAMIKQVISNVVWMRVQENFTGKVQILLAILQIKITVQKKESKSCMLSTHVQWMGRKLIGSDSWPQSSLHHTDLRLALICAQETEAAA